MASDIEASSAAEIEDLSRLCNLSKQVFISLALLFRAIRNDEPELARAALTSLYTDSERRGLADEMKELFNKVGDLLPRVNRDESVTGESTTCDAAITLLANMSVALDLILKTGPEDRGDELVRRAVSQWVKVRYKLIDDAIASEKRPFHAAYTEALEQEIIEAKRGVRAARLEAEVRGDGENKIDPEPRLCVDVEDRVIRIDGQHIGLRGSEAVKQRLAEFYKELIKADGEFCVMGGQVRTRDIENQAEEVRGLIESQPGAGTRIPREKLWCNLVHFFSFSRQEPVETSGVTKSILGF